MDAVMVLAELPAMAKGPRKRKKPIVWANPDQPRNFLYEWREYRGLTQEILAHRVGLEGAPSISMLENGKMGFEGTTLFALGRALKCNPGALLMIEDPRTWDRFWRLWDRLRPAERTRTVARAIEDMEFYLQQQAPEIVGEEEDRPPKS